MYGLELVFSNGENFKTESSEADTSWYTLDPTKGQLVNIHAATDKKVGPNEDSLPMYLQLGFSDRSKDEGSP